MGLRDRDPTIQLPGVTLTQLQSDDSQEMLEKGLPKREQSLAVRIADGDESAEQELVTQYRRGVFLMIHAKLRDVETSEDLCQDTFVHILQGLREGKLRQADRLAAYVAGTARNVARTYLRNRQRRERLAPRDLAVDVGGPELECEQNELLAIAHRSLARLGESDKTILRLSLIEGLTPAEIADCLRITPEATRQRKLRALKRFRQSFEELSRVDPSGHKQ